MKAVFKLETRDNIVEFVDQVMSTFTSYIPERLKEDVRQELFVDCLTQYREANTATIQESNVLRAIATAANGVADTVIDTGTYNHTAPGFNDIEDYVVEQYYHEELIIGIHKAVDSLPPKEREVISMLYGLDGREQVESMSELGRRVGERFPHTSFKATGDRAPFSITHMRRMSRNAMDHVGAGMKRCTR